MTANIWDVWSRAETGPICPTRKFDTRVYWMKLKEIAKEYALTYDPEIIVPTDETLIDDAYRAGMDLAVEVGVLCTDTERIIKFEEKELKETIRNLPKETTIGEGKDKVIVTPRKIGDQSPPLTLGRVQGPVSEKMQPKIYESFVQEPKVNIFNPQGSVTTIGGVRVKTGSPLEVYAELHNAMCARTVLRKVGRPGMPLWRGPTPGAVANIAASSPEYGYRPCDSGNVVLLPQLKTNYKQLCKAAHYLQYGCTSYGQSQALVGGLAGGVDTTVITAVAGCILSYALYRHQYILCSTSVRALARSAPNVTKKERIRLWGRHLAQAAVNKHTNMIIFGGSLPYAGPCTKMEFIEYASGAIGGVAVGSHLKGGTGRSSIEIDCQTGMEARFLAEVGRAAAGVRREDANELVLALVKKYEKNIDNNSAPAGKKFYECYDIKTLTPTKEYLRVYGEVKKELEDIGVNLGS